MGMEIAHNHIDLVGKILADTFGEKSFAVFGLAGLCIATDTFISTEQANRMGGLLRMTKVEQMILKEYEDRENDLRKQLEESNLNNQKLQKTLDALVQKLIQDGISPDKIRQAAGDAVI